MLAVPSHDRRQVRCRRQDRRAPVYAVRAHSTLVPVAWSRPAKPRFNRTLHFEPGPDEPGSTGAVGAGAIQRDAQQHPSLTLHRGAVVVPVLVLAGDAPAIVDQAVQRVG
jgi:hypothetical protein